MNKDFWPHISINCIQNRYFGMKEVIGNLVITNLPKYLEKSNDQSATDKSIQYDSKRVRRSIVDAYEGLISFFNCLFSHFLVHFSGIISTK